MSHIEKAEEYTCFGAERTQMTNRSDSSLETEYIQPSNPQKRSGDNERQSRASKSSTDVMQNWMNTVQQMDCIDGMRLMPSKSVDLILADPPYNLSKGNRWAWDRSVELPGFGGAWSKVMEHWDNMSFSDYWCFTASWLTESKRILKPTGSIWVFGTYHNIGILNTLFQILGIEIINEIIWFKRNAFPNLSGRRFTASHENLLWGHVGRKQRRYYFNYQEAKNGDFPEDLVKKPGRQMRTVWDIPNNKSKEELRFGKHPTQKPVALINRVVSLTSRTGDLCLIPFAGAGTECVSAKMLGRKFIAFEVNRKYVEVTRKRLSCIAPAKQTRIGDFGGS
jgi:site-specific DNA-methyltransferase (adenine-specific)